LTGLAGLGLWMLLDRNLKRVVLGIVVLGNAINLGVITAGRFFGERPAFVEAGNAVSTANPLPQALVLTAIVIGFSLFIFTLALLKANACAVVKDTICAVDSCAMALVDKAFKDVVANPEIWSVLKPAT
jgi:multisubunit Na+/H+ antiporter MnhC subunit